MIEKSKVANLFINLLLTAGTLLVIIVGFEIALRIYYSRSPLVKGFVMPPGCPYIYGLNPNRRGISSQGLRDREFAIPKPKNTRRILLLGDSVAHSLGVSAENSFAKILERKLNEGQQRFEVINTGVSAYTTYNELQFYLHKGREFQPDVVVVTFCMNDVVDPVPHWKLQFEPEILMNLPSDAIPNLEYHQRVVLPSIKWQSRLAFLRHTALYRFLGIENKMLNRSVRQLDPKYVEVNGKRWPTYLAAEEAVDIRVLTEYESSEWRWLRSMFDRLNQAVKSDGATLVIIVVPLSYQLDDDYPFLPQTQLLRYCSEKSIPYLDLLPVFRAHRDENLFIQASIGTDIFHPSAIGHRLIANALESLLLEHHLVDATGVNLSPTEVSTR